MISTIIKISIACLLLNNAYFLMNAVSKYNSPSVDPSNFSYQLDNLIGEVLGLKFFQSANCDYVCADKCLNNKKAIKSQSSFSQCINTKCGCYFLDNHMLSGFSSFSIIISTLILLMISVYLSLRKPKQDLTSYNKLPNSEEDIVRSNETLHEKLIGGALDF